MKARAHGKPMTLQESLGRLEASQEIAERILDLQFADPVCKDEEEMIVPGVFWLHLVRLARVATGQMHPNDQRKEKP